MNKKTSLGWFTGTMYFLHSLFAFANAADRIKDKNLYAQGQVQVQFIKENNQLLIDLAAPGEDVMGFEHVPKTTEEKISYNRVMTILNNPKTFISVNEEAACSIAGKNIEYSLNKNKSKQEHRGEFLAQYSYNCKYPDKIKDVKYHWFTSFPATKKINNTFLLNQGKKKHGEVTAKSRRFYFK